jgi:hypothetical protein
VLLPAYQGDVVPLNMICPHRKQLSPTVLLHAAVKEACDAVMSRAASLSHLAGALANDASAVPVHDIKEINRERNVHPVSEPFRHWQKILRRKDRDTGIVNWRGSLMDNLPGKKFTPGRGFRRNSRGEDQEWLNVTFIIITRSSSVF